VAYERDLQPGRNALTVAGRHLLVVYDAEHGTAEAYDGTCPHRGYLLGVGGTLRGDRIVCPFHGQVIGLGSGSGCALAVARHPTLLAGGLLFVRTGDADAGFAQRIAALDANHYIVPGFCRRIAAPAELVIENAFDGAHFQPVHGIGNAPAMETAQAAGGPYVGTARFALPPSAWHGDAPVAAPFRASAFSPTLVVTELGGPHPYIMLTATVPIDARLCEVRLSVMVPADEDGREPDAGKLRYLLRQAEAGVDKDALIWENLADPGAIVHALPFDGPVLGFRDFCAGFR